MRVTFFESINAVMENSLRDFFFKLQISFFLKSRIRAQLCANAWICASQVTDRDLASVIASFFVNAWILAPRATDRDHESVSTKER